MNNDRFAKAQFATILGIIVNIFLTIIKAVAGLMANSRALIADAFESAADIISSLTVLIGIRAARKPPDSEHPYGHGKAENVASLIVAILLIIVGFEIVIQSIQAVWIEDKESTGILALYVIIFTIIIKEILFQYKFRLGKKINSPAVIADAWHHRSDAISSIIALVGVGLTIIGDKMDISYLQNFDPIAGAIIGVIVMWMGFKIGRDAVNVTLETVLSSEETVPFKETTLNVEGVKRIDALKARTHGSYVIIDLKISVDPNISVYEGHAIAARVKEKLIEKHEQVHDVNVHVNPYN